MALLGEFGEASAEERVFRGPRNSGGRSDELLRRRFAHLPLLKTHRSLRMTFSSRSASLQQRDSLPKTHAFRERAWRNSLKIPSCRRHLRHLPLRLLPRFRPLPCQASRAPNFLLIFFLRF